MKIIVAPDSFKGSLEAFEICDIVERAAKDVFEEIEVVKIPLADGGEGTVKALTHSLNAKLVQVDVMSPDFMNTTANYAIFDNNNKAIMEMAEASGITKVINRNIFKLSTFGTGQMVIDAIDKGVEEIYIGIGGSATNDCGIGFASALGYKFLDCNDNEVQALVENIDKIVKIDNSSVDSRVYKTKFTILCDVKNPLTGKNGASYVFSKQKGASDEDVIVLDALLNKMGLLFERTFNKEIINVPGSGAAGGLGAGILAFTNSQIRLGVETILDILDFKNKLHDIDLVVTGEGKMDNQSCFGKVCFGVSNSSKEASVPCMAIVGGLGEGYVEMYKHGLTSVVTTVSSIMTLDEAIENANELCYQAAVRLFRSILYTKCV